jgi:lysophospholipase III
MAFTLSFIFAFASIFSGATAYFVISAEDYLQELDFQGFPVVLVPGDGGSQLEARLNKSTVVHYLCAKKTDDYFDLWLNLELLIPVILDCFVDNMRLVYDNVTRTTSNSPGVDIRVPGFGNTSTVEWLDPSQVSPGAYFKDIVDLLQKSGYQRNVDVRGAPYDFRKGPQELGYFFENLKELVEDTYNNSGKKVVMVAHSMGSPFTVHFLNGQTQAWKDKYIKAIITLAGVWGGAVKAVRVFATGFCPVHNTCVSIELCSYTKSG